MSLRNVEVKGKIREWEKSLALAERLAGAPPVLLRQRDTFYGGSTVAGRLKLRRENDTAVLVHYERPDVPGPKLSDYCLCPVSDPDALHLCLERALSSTSQLNKDRYLFMVGQTRIHMDRVEGLGDFAELEVVLEPEQTLEEGEKICNDLLTQLEIDSSNLLSGPKSASSVFSSTSVYFIRHLALTLAVKVEFANDFHSSSNLTTKEMSDKVVEYHEESQAERLSRKTKESPFMIVGLLGLTVACGIGAYQYKNRGRMRTSIYLMRLRVIAQGTVVGTLALGATYNVSTRLIERYNRSH